MNRHSILSSLVLAIAFSVQCLNAAESPAATAHGKRGNKTAPGDTSPQLPLNKQSQQKVKRAHHLAEKAANSEFLNSPQGIDCKQQIAAVDQEINAVYEKYLNTFREDPATEKGKTLREERDRLLQALSQKQKQIESDYEHLKINSPAYRAMVEKHLKSQLRQLKGKLRPQSSEKSEDNQ